MVTIVRTIGSYRRREISYHAQMPLDVLGHRFYSPIEIKYESQGGWRSKRVARAAPNRLIGGWLLAFRNGRLTNFQDRTRLGAPSGY